MEVHIKTEADHSGLSQQEVIKLREQFGRNELRKEKNFLPALIRDVVTEPMFILLAVACTVYLLLGQMNEGLMTIVAILIVCAISIYQGVRSTKALKALKELTEPKIKVIRGSKEEIIPSADLVPGDIMIIEEGEKIPADAILLKCNDLSINEAAMTGESLPVEKKSNDPIFQGTVVQSGMCHARVTTTGNKTELGKIGKAIETYSAPKTLLQHAISRFVRQLALFGILAFVFIWWYNYYQSGDILRSLLFGLTLTMAAIPEEIPVAFSSFMALGAYRMARLGIITRQPTVIENLGAVSVICLDKTGTITENRMEVNQLYHYSEDRVSGPEKSGLLDFAILASEISPFDEMEKALHNAYDSFNGIPLPEMVFEYHLGGSPPMMTHVFGREGSYTVAAKGAPERIMRVCKLSEEEREKIGGMVIKMADTGSRVIAVAHCEHRAELPASQDDFQWKFAGLISLYDPPRKNLGDVFRQFASAGIDAKLLTGDFPQTASYIAEKAGLPDKRQAILGEEVMRLPMEELQKKVKDTVIFARMFPDAKLKVIEALKLNGEIVAMTGDGVNDGPALKASNIGIAMGHGGTQIARQASDIILTDDDIHKVTDAIRHGRRIFANLKKAIRYIISIHIPIILTASLPLLFGWKYPNIFTPIHVIFLELIMGPTCSIFFENEPEPVNSMQQPPRKRHIGLFEKGELRISILQGLGITIAVLFLYYFFSETHDIEAVRSVVFTTLLMSNIFLTFTNRSFTESVFKTIRYRNNLVPVMLVISISLLVLIHVIPAIRGIFGMSAISFGETTLCLAVAFAGVMWFELYKHVVRRKINS